MANATNALQAANNGTTTIPILGTSVTDYPTALDLDRNAYAQSGGIVGTNVSGTSDLAPLDQQAQMLVDLYPDATKVGLLYCSAEPNSQYQIDVIKPLLEAAGKTCTLFSFSDSNDIAQVAAAAAAASDVIYVPTDNTVADCTGAVLGAIGDTPIIAGEEGICSGCGVATLSISYLELGRITGEMAVKILKGEAKVEEMAVQFASAPTKKYNKQRCEELGIDTAALEAKGYVAIATE
jgi:putative ABC transport system substrate-binding protein